MLRSTWQLGSVSLRSSVTVPLVIIAPMVPSQTNKVKQLTALAPHSSTRGFSEHPRRWSSCRGRAPAFGRAASEPAAAWRRSVPWRSACGTSWGAACATGAGSPRWATRPAPASRTRGRSSPAASSPCWPATPDTRSITYFTRYTITHGYHLQSRMQWNSTTKTTKVVPK